MRHYRNGNGGSTAWWILGGLITLGLTLLVAREIPAVRRELRIMRM